MYIKYQDWMQDFGKGVRFEQFKAKTHEISKFSPKSPWKWNNSCQKRGSSNTTKPLWIRPWVLWLKIYFRYLKNYIRIISRTFFYKIFKYLFISMVFITSTSNL